MKHVIAAAFFVAYTCATSAENARPPQPMCPKGSALVYQCTSGAIEVTLCSSNLGAGGPPVLQYRLRDATAPLTVSRPFQPIPWESVAATIDDSGAKSSTAGVRFKASDVAIELSHEQSAFESDIGLFTLTPTGGRASTHACGTNSLRVSRPAIEALAEKVSAAAMTRSTNK